jgi:hypothetical protein
VRIPAHRVKHGKKLSKTMQRLMLDKYMRGYLKYKTNIEDKPILGEILQEILDLNNYFLTFMNQLEDIKKSLRTETNIDKLRQKIDKLLT